MAGRPFALESDLSGERQRSTVGSWFKELDFARLSSTNRNLLSRLSGNNKKEINKVKKDEMKQKKSVRNSRVWILPG